MLKLCIFGGAITKLLAVLFSIYLILWIQSFAAKGIIADVDEGKTIYMKIMIVSVFISTLTIPFIGKLCDSIEETKIMPVAFIVRGLSTVAFCFLKTPDSIGAYIICVIMIVGTIVENLSIESLYLKNLPKETRGVLCGAMSFVGQFGILFYSLVGGYIFDHIGPKSPFAFLGILDFIFVLICLVCHQSNIIRF